jgi:hypothetical protein
MMGLWLSILLGFTLLGGTRQQPASPEHAPTSEIRGRITDAESGKPLARAVVRLRTLDSKEDIIARADDSGFYRFSGLAAGRYNGAVYAGEFRSTHLVEPLAATTSQSRPIELANGEVREINVALRRTRAITVRVVDPWGDPLSGLRAIVRSLDDVTSVPPSSLARTTDDRGIVRIYGLSSGRYVVCADTDPLESVKDSEERRERLVLLRTCYRSGEEAEAEPVRLDREDIGELEIRMRVGRTFSVSGRILDASASPASDTRASLSAFRSNGSNSRGILIDGEGRFSLANVLPGEYAIVASLGGPDWPEHRRTLQAGFLPFRVDASDVTDLVVIMERGIDVTGRITLEDSTGILPAAAGSGLMVLARLADDPLDGWGSSLVAPVREEDGTFLLTGIFARRTIEFVNVPRGWYVKSVRYAGREIIDDAVDFKQANDAPPIEVVLSSHGAVVTGRVLNNSGAPVGGAMVVLFRADETASNVRLVSSTRASSAGAFRLGPARSGNYLIVGLPPSTPMFRPGERSRLARLSAAAHRITLRDLDERILDIHVVNDR